MRRLVSLFRAAWRRDRFEHDMDEEMRFHLDTRTADLVRRGHTPAEAARRARLDFGNVSAYRDRCRDARRLTILDDMRIDLRFALRAMRKDVQVSATIVATLALGIGATAAMFTAVNAALLRPLPFTDPARLVMVFAGPSDPMPAFGPDFTEWRAGCGTCAGIAAFGQWQSTVAGGVEAERVLVGRVTPSFFDTLGVQPILGRAFLPDEMGRALFGLGDGPVTNAAVILSAPLWRRQFHADPGIIGRTIRIDGDPAIVVGVMPDGFAFPDRAEAWTPAAISTTRGNAYLHVLARLKPGTSLAQADAEFKSLIARMQQQSPDDRRASVVHLVPLQEHLVGDVRTSLTIFLAAVTVVLLIACANVANLLLAQAATRPREMAMRTILGAGRGRLVRQLLTESVLLAAAGGIAGLFLTVWILAVFRGTLPESVPRLNAIAVDGSVVAFVALLSIASGLLFGLAPAWRTATADLNAALKEGAGRGSGGPDRRRIRGVLVVAEVSLAMVLLIGAALLTKSFVTLRTRPIGFNSIGVLTANVSLPETGYATGSHVKTYLRDALARLQARPDLERVGIVSALPLSRHGARIRGSVRADGEEKARRGAFPAKLAVGGDYFGTMGIGLVRGRLFDGRDGANAPPVAIVSDSLASRLWPGQNPLGRRINVGFGGEPWREVVGVVGDVKHDALGQGPSQALYQPFEQVPDERRWQIGEMTFAVRAASSSAAAQLLRATLRDIDPEVPLYDLTPMRDVVANNAADPRFYALLMGSLSAVAFVLAIAGIYGVVSYSARQRTHELGVRVALGARRADIALLVLREGMVLVGLGAILGLGGAYAATRTLTRFLFDVTVTDPATFVTVPIILCGTALVACYVPARRATAVDPLVALKYE